MLALNVHLGVPWADKEIARNLRRDEASPIFIYAGSTNVGLFALQLAKMAGLRVITTASPRSFDLVKRYGAHDVFDYRSSSAIEEITRLYPNITRAMDCFSEGGSTAFCAQVLKNSAGKVVTLLDSGKTTVPGVTNKLILVYTVFGRPFSWLPPIGPSYPAVPSDRQALVRFYASLPELIKELKPPPISKVGGGLDCIHEGIDMLRKGEVSGTKLVADL